MKTFFVISSHVFAAANNKDTYMKNYSLFLYLTLTLLSHGSENTSKIPLMKKSQKAFKRHTKPDVHNAKVSPSPSMLAQALHNQQFEQAKCILSCYPSFAHSIIARTNRPMEWYAKTPAMIQLLENAKQIIKLNQSIKDMSLSCPEHEEHTI